jgi:hypothetical protein
MTTPRKTKPRSRTRTTRRAPETETVEGGAHMLPVMTRPRSSSVDEAPTVARETTARITAIQRIKSLGEAWTSLRANPFPDDNARTSANPHRTAVRELYRSFRGNLAEELNIAASTTGDEAREALRAAIVLAGENKAATDLAFTGNESDPVALTALVTTGNQLDKILRGCRAALSALWLEAAATIPWRITTRAELSAIGAVGVVYDYEGTGTKEKRARVLKADDPARPDRFGPLLLSNLLHTRISRVNAPEALDVSASRADLVHYVVNGKLEVPGANAAKDRADTIARFKAPGALILSFSTAPGNDLRGLARTLETSRGRLRKVLTDRDFWTTMGRVTVIDRFVGHDDRLATVGTNIGNIMISGSPGTVSVVDNYDNNSAQASGQAGYYEGLFDPLRPANISGTALDIVNDVLKQINAEATKQSGKDQIDRTKSLLSYSGNQAETFSGYFIEGVNAAIAELGVMFTDSNQAPRTRQLIEEIVDRAARTGRDADKVPGLWNTLVARLGRVQDTLKA